MKDNNFVNIKIQEFTGIAVDSWAKQGFNHIFMDRSFDAKHIDPLNSTIVINNQPVKVLVQVHGIEVLAAKEENAFKSADGWICNDRSWLIENGQATAFAIRTADCIPVIIYDISSARYSLLHCGWRSAVDGIGVEAIDKLILAGSKIKDLEVALGPGAGCCCYEVDQDFKEVIAQSLSKLIPRINLSYQLNYSSTELGSIILNYLEAVLVNRSGKIFFDLKEYLRLVFNFTGLSKVYVSDECTICNKQFFSFRRDQDNAGRQLTICF